MILFAIYRDGTHRGNITGINGDDAIRRYIVSSDLKEMINNTDFVKRYSYQIAIEGVHYIEGTYEPNKKIQEYT